MENIPKTNPRVSVILASYNGEKYIAKAIKSVLNQSYYNFELAIVNDGSQDSTKKIIENFSKRDGRIVIFDNKENIGFPKSLNLGLEVAKGEYIARIDDDDEWICSDKLEKQVKFLDTNKEYVLVGTGIIAIDETEKELGKYLYPATDEEIRKQSLVRCCFAHSSVLFRKEAALNCGGYDESRELYPLEDHDLWLKLGISGKFANISEYCIKYMVRAGSMSRNKPLEQAKKGIFLTKKYRNQYPNYSKTIVLRCLGILKIVFLRILPFSLRKKMTNFKFKIKTLLRIK
jgi:glycosyltransferase involved in cell wall biosynthesis